MAALLDATDLQDALPEMKKWLEEKIAAQARAYDRGEMARKEGK